MNISKNINIDPVKNTFSRLPQLVLVFLMVFLSAGALKATHIVGGDITYECLGFDDYEVTLTFRLDCENGEEPFDDIAHVGIFDGYGNLLPWFGTGGMILMQNPQIDTIDTSLDTGCELIGEQVCVVQAIYKGVINLPKRESGYYFAYQRCCRNVTLTNIVDPLTTGATIYIRLLEEEMEEGVCNSSPTFNQWPNIYECVNSTFTFDHSATDPENDSLVYKLCTPADGATFDEPFPVPPAGPQYEDVVYKAPFTFDDPMGGIPLTINPETGVLTATPDAIGQWLIGVCVEEYRDGKLVTTVRRFFEYNTRVCAEGPIALFDVPNPFCDGLEFTPTNESTDADSYLWTVEPSDGVTFDANAENPTFTFPENGIYTISLEAFRDLDGCSNIYFEDVGVYDSNLEASFTASIESCAGDSTLVVLNSTSTDPDYDIESWEWTVNAPGFNTTASGEMTSVTVPTVDNVEITLVATSSNGCDATITESFDADPLDLELLANPMAICQGDSLEILVNPNCDLTYTITPLDYVIFDDPDDPCVITIAPQEVVTYTITVTDGICTASEEFMVDVIEKADISIVGDSISCDGMANLTVVGGLAGNQFEWSTNSNFDPIIGMGETLDYAMTEQTQTFYVQVKEGTGCSNIASITVSDETVDISYPDAITLCTGIEEEIIVINNNPDHDIVITWDDNPIIIMTTDSSVIISTDDASINTTITFTATNQHGCIEEGSIAIDAEERPTIDFTWEVTCGTLEMCFTNNTSPIDNDYSWDFGDLTTNDDVSTEVNPCYTYPEPGVYNVTLYITSGACAGDSLVQEVTVPVIPEIEINSDDLNLCLGDVVTITATTNTDGEITWEDGSGTVGEGSEIEYTGSDSTQIIVTIVDANGCSASDTIDVNVYIFNLSDDVPEISCVDEEVTVTLTNNSAGNNFTYDWEPQECILEGEGTPVVVISGQDTKEITVLVTNTDNGCDTLYSFNFNVSVINKSIGVNPDLTQNIFQCDEIEVFVEPADDACTYEWATGETESMIIDTILETTTYTVTITDENGCTLEQSITVDPLLPECNENDVFLPNAFSPNSDGANDVLFVRSNFVKTLDFAIYDRWGEQLFRTTDIDVGWDGTFKGSELAPDVYAYCIIATCSNGAEYKATGNVTLLK